MEVERRRSPDIQKKTKRILPKAPRENEIPEKVENVSQWILKNSTQLPSIILNPVKTNLNTTTTKQKLHNSSNSISFNVVDMPMIEINMSEKSRSYGNDQFLELNVLKEKNQAHQINIETFENVYNGSEPIGYCHRNAASAKYERRSICYGSLRKALRNENLTEQQIQALVSTQNGRNIYPNEITVNGHDFTIENNNRKQSLNNNNTNDLLLKDEYENDEICTITGLDSESFVGGFFERSSSRSELNDLKRRQCKNNSENELSDPTSTDKKNQLKMESLSPILSQKQTALVYGGNYFKQLKVQDQFRSQSSISSNVSSISLSTCSSNNIAHKFTENIYLKDYSHRSNSIDNKISTSHRNCQKIMSDPAKYYAQFKTQQHQNNTNINTKENNHVLRSVSPYYTRNEPSSNNNNNKFNFDMPIKLIADSYLLSPTGFNVTLSKSTSKINLDDFRASSPFNAKSCNAVNNCGSQSDTNISDPELLNNKSELDKQKSISTHRLTTNHDDDSYRNTSLKSMDISNEKLDKKLKKDEYKIKPNFVEELSYKFPEEGSGRIPIKKLSYDESHYTTKYKKRNFSMKESRSNSQEIHGEYLGKIKIKLSHNEDQQQLIVTVIEAAELIAKDSNGFSDPFVKICLLPGREKDHKRRTHHVLKNLNPVWNHSSVYPNVYREELRNKTLEFSTWDWDRFKKNDFLGIVRIDLNEEVYLDNEPRWFRLKNS